MGFTSQRRLRVGVLGCGPIAQAAHFESVTKARNAELYAICDVAEDLLERMAWTHAPTRTFRDYDAMLADPGSRCRYRRDRGCLPRSCCEGCTPCGQARPMREAARRLGGGS